MNPVRERKPDRWLVIIVGQIDDIEQALEALEENQQEAWIGFDCTGDDDEVTATINLRWIDKSMVHLVSEIIRHDFPHIKIKANRGEYNDNANGSV